MARGVFLFYDSIVSEDVALAAQLGPTSSFLIPEKRSNKKRGLLRYFSVRIARIGIHFLYYHRWAEKSTDFTTLSRPQHKLHHLPRLAVVVPLLFAVRLASQHYSTAVDVVICLV